MFVFVSRLFLESRDKKMFIINLIVAFTIAYRGLITFSRGGMVTGFVMVFSLILFVYINIKKTEKYKLQLLFAFLIIALGITWGYTSFRTGGLIDKRYANQDAAGREKESALSGREEIWNSEIDYFFDSPIFGVGVAKSAELRVENSGIYVMSHSEISRTLAEHGALGIMALLIVFLTPIFLYMDNKQHIYMFCFLFFWLLTINHAAMRIAAPAFVYALSLLKVQFDKVVESV
jgi:O-antigen ligase